MSSINFSAVAETVQIAISDVEFMAINPNNVNSMPNSVTVNTDSSRESHNLEQAMPLGSRGRYVYIHLLGTGNMYVGEIEVFPTIHYSELTSLHLGELRS